MCALDMFPFPNKDLYEEFSHYTTHGVGITTIPIDVMVDFASGLNQKHLVKIADLLGDDSKDISVVSVLHADARVSRIGNLPFASRLSIDIEHEVSV